MSMTKNLNWAAEVVPGVSLMGLTLGTSFKTVREALQSCAVVGGSEIKFENSPKLSMEEEDGQAIYLKVAELQVNYSWQNEVARLIFKDGLLTSIIVETVWEGENYEYKGKFLESIGLGTAVADLLRHGTWKYDEDEEHFYPTDKFAGLLVASGRGCDLATDPDQKIGFIRVYKE